jgi:hypothetical protein
MIIMNCLDRELLVGTKEECRDIWNAEPEKRSRLYTEADVCLMLLLEPDHLQKIFQAKDKRPATKVAELREKGGY